MSALSGQRGRLIPGMNNNKTLPMNGVNGYFLSPGR